LPDLKGAASGKEEKAGGKCHKIAIKKRSQKKERRRRKKGLRWLS